MAGTDGLDTKWVVNLLKKSFRDNEPLDLDEVSISLASAVGENFLSTVYRVQIRMLLSSGRRKQFSVIVKNEVDGGKIGFVMGALSLFHIECKMYTVILPMMNELMEEFNDKRDTFTPNCLGHQPYSSIVMDDLGFYGYSSVDRTKWLTVEQSKLVLRTLARFHAMSKILLLRGLLTEDDRGHNLFVNDTPVFRTIIPGSVRVLSSAIKKNWGADWRLVAEKISSNENLICDKLLANGKYDKKFEVLNHGDLWTSNIMWKFTECENVPYSVKFIDWQFAHINSFIVDVTYFLHTSVIPNLRRARLNDLLDTYHEALERNLSLYGWKGYVPTRSDVRDEYDRVGALRYVFVACSLPVTSTGVPGLSLDVGAVFDKPVDQCFNEAIFTEEKFVREVGPDLKEFCENGVL